MFSFGGDPYEDDRSDGSDPMIDPPELDFAIKMKLPSEEITWNISQHQIQDLQRRMKKSQDQFSNSSDMCGLRSHSVNVSFSVPRKPNLSMIANLCCELSGKSNWSLYLELRNVSRGTHTILIKVNVNSRYQSQKKTILQGDPNGSSADKIFLIKNFGVADHGNGYRQVVHYGYAHAVGGQNIDIKATIELDQTSAETEREEDDEVNSLVCDLRNLADSGLGTDLTIVCEGKGTSGIPQQFLNVHRALLIARSDVFAKMLTSQTLTEAKTNVVRIKDVEVGPLNQMIRFMYTDKVEDLDKHAADLLMLSEKYNLQKLKKMAEASLCRTMKLEQVIWLVSYADIHNGQSVVETAINMIVENFVDVIKHQLWGEFVKKRPELLVRIHEKLAGKFYK